MVKPKGRPTKNTIHVNLRLSKIMVQRIDEICESLGTNRPEFITSLIIEELRRQ